MARNANLHSAKRAKNDEFYTQPTDIEKELRHYWPHFKGKTVLCNCDDPYESNFFKYFALNFNKLGLKKLTATCYAGSPVAGRKLDVPDERGRSRVPYKATMTCLRDATGDGAETMEDVAELFRTGENELTRLTGDGDFRSTECLELLDEADVVVTNPPFSLFREFVRVLMERDKRFVIVGNKNAITYKEVFPLIKENRVWLGHTAVKEFMRPDGSTKKFGNVGWYTNLEIEKRSEELILVKRYRGHEDEYPRYDNYDAINVDRVKDIPEDYLGVMGVPITFLDKYCPEQFEIVGFDGNDYAKELGIEPIGKEWVDVYRRQGGTGHMSPSMHSLVLHEGGWRRPSTSESLSDGEPGPHHGSEEHDLLRRKEPIRESGDKAQEQLSNSRVQLSTRRPRVPYAGRAVEREDRRQGRV